jgi:hypothetical protein
MMGGGGSKKASGGDGFRVMRIILWVPRMVSQSLPSPAQEVSADNLYTTQTPECSKGKYNAKIRKQKSPKVSPTTYVGRRLEERKKRRG